MRPLSEADMERAFARLSDHLEKYHVRAEFHVVDRAVMCLVHEAARRVAEDEGLPADWLNDAAKAFVPDGASFELWRSMSHLSVLTADVPTLFAMKCAAARTAEDADDIRFLARLMEVTSAEAALKVVERYVPAERLLVRSRLLLEELFNDGP